MRTHSLLTVSITLSLSVLLGCSPEATEDGTATGSDPVLDTTAPGTNPATTPTQTATTGTATGGAEVTALRGMVLDISEYPIEGVMVTTSTGLETTTDSLGRWSFEDIEDLGVVGVDFKKAGYASNQKPIIIYENTEHALNTTMAEVDFVGSFIPTDGLTINIDDGGAVIELPAGIYQTKDGDLVTDEVFVDATLFDVTYTPGQPSEREAAPGNFFAEPDIDEAAPPSPDEEVEPQVLESFGMWDVNLTDKDGNDLELPDGESAFVTVALQGSGPIAGDTIPSWKYDEDTYQWTRKEEGVVVENAITGRLDYEVEVKDGFSSWNTDYPISTFGCVVCSLGELSALPITGVSMSAEGISYNATTSGSIGSDGQVCVEVKNDSTISLTTSYTIAGQTFTEKWGETVSIPPFQATCDGASVCTDIGTCPLDIPF